MNRIDKRNYYLNIAKECAARSTCLRKKYGAVIVKDDEIISTGYNGAPRGRENCCDLGTCLRIKMNIPSGQRYEICRSVHAEMNAIISASRKEMIGATLYLYGIDFNTGEMIENPKPCSMCKRLILNSGIKEIITRDKNETWVTLTDCYILNDDSKVEDTYGK